VCQVLGKRLGPAFKTLLPLIKDLPSAAVQALDATGSLEVGGHVVNKDEVTITRAFMGDTTVYDAANNPEGTVTVVLNHVLTDDLRSMVRCCSLLPCCQPLCCSRVCVVGFWPHRVWLASWCHTSKLFAKPASCQYLTLLRSTLRVHMLWEWVVSSARVIDRVFVFLRGSGTF
jgi:hypothetical protein